MSLNKQKVNTAFDKAGTRLIGELQAALVAADAVATGKTRDSLEYSINYVGPIIQFTLTGGKGWAFVEQGRGPTVNKSGDGALFRAIKEWAAARGVPEAAVYPITRKIHKQGTRLHVNKERRDIYTGIITKRAVENIALSIGVLGAVTTQSDIIQAFRK